MSWSKFSVLFLVLLISGCSSAHTVRNEACPIRDRAQLKFVDMFDGTPEELVILMPDVAYETSGKWSLDYVYDAKRFVTVRCKYTDGESIDVKISERIKSCNYKINTQRNLALSCK